MAKLRVGSEAYQLSGVAQSLDDYYTGRGEADGAWLGVGAERLGLSGPVGADDLRAVLAGMAPGAGGLTPDGATVRTHVRRVPGFDATFKAPKSVSVLYAVSDDPRVQGAIIEAGEAAVRAAVSWLEREAIWVRRGSGDVAYLNDLAGRDPDAASAARQHPVRGRGLVAAAFRHRTSRAGDPLLHWHTLLANMVEGPDGRWGAFVHPELYRHARAAGEVFQTVLRGELTARLGLEWRPGAHVPEIAGVPEQVCAMFSKRAAEIDAWLATTGTPGDPAGRQAAVLATRRGKPELEGERFDAAWKAEAVDAGWGPAAAEALTSSSAGRDAAEMGEVWRIPTVDHETGAAIDRAVDPEDWIATLGRALTESDSTFTRPDLVRAVAARIGEGATAATIERVVARVLSSAQIVPVVDGGIARWSTGELLDVERRFLAIADDSRGTRAPVAVNDLDEMLAGSSLGVDQEQAARVLTGALDAVSVLVGPAGTGKTFTLDVVRRVFETAGHDVVGVAPSARAAQELEADASIASSTIHRLLGAWERGQRLPTGSTVLVVDEAGMAGIRDLERVVAPVVAAGGRVILVGDHHQLPEVSAGGGFAALAGGRATTVAELTINRRQQQTWEIDALAELRDGHVAAAVAAYRTHERVVVSADRAAMVDVAVERWLAAHRGGSVPVLLAGTNEMVDALNSKVRSALAELGVLGPAVHAGDVTLAIGDRVMIRANDYHAATVDGRPAWLLNGHTGTLSGVTDRGLVLTMDHDDSHVVVTFAHMADHPLAWAYASTAHKAQGGTWDLAITVGLDGLYREAGYLVMSRGRQSNMILVTQPEIDDIDAELARHDSALRLPGEQPDSIDTVLIDQLTVSRRKLLATTRDAHATAVHEAATDLDYPTLERWAAYAHAVEAQATRLVGGDPDRHRDRLTRTEHTARHIAIGQRVKAWDRRNIGTATGIDDTAGTVQVTFVATDGRAATKTMGWGDVTIVDPRRPQPRQLGAAAAATLATGTAELRAQLHRWDEHLRDHGVQPGDRHVYSRAAALAVDRGAARLTADSPAWLSELLGPRPLDRPAATQVWDDAVHAVATQRLRHGLTDTARPIGPDAGGDAAAAWRDVARVVTASRLWLDTHTIRPDTAIVRSRSPRELHQRRLELRLILDGAPADVRGLIGRLRSGGALPTFDISELLQSALAARGDRQRWILEHWPHVVEAAEVDHALRHHLAVADPDPILDTLANSAEPLLATAATEPEPWLITLVTQLVAPDATSIEPRLERLLGDVARHRHRWQITTLDPLGDAAVDIDQADERTLLTLAINATIDALDLPAPAGTDAGIDPSPSLLDLPAP